MLTNRKLIVFDWDDVITLGSKEGYFACYREALGDRIGNTISWEDARRDILATWGSTARDAISAILKDYPQDIEEVLALYQERILGDTFSSRLSVVPGLQKFLLELSKEYTLCVTTGMHPQTLHEDVMPRFGIPKVFKDIISGYDIEDPKLRKPNPYSVNLFMEKHGALPEETIVVGDAENDVKMARAAKVEPVVVLTGHLTREAAEGLGVSYVIPDVTQLMSVLGK